MKYINDNIIFYCLFYEFESYLGFFIVWNFMMLEIVCEIFSVFDGKL